MISLCSFRVTLNEHQVVSFHSPLSRLLSHVYANIRENIKASHYWPILRNIHQWQVNSSHKGPVMREALLYTEIHAQYVPRNDCFSNHELTPFILGWATSVIEVVVCCFCWYYSSYHYQFSSSRHEFWIAYMAIVQAWFQWRKIRQNIGECHFEWWNAIEFKSHI